MTGCDGCDAFVTVIEVIVTIAGLGVMISIISISEYYSPFWAHFQAELKMRPNLREVYVICLFYRTSGGGWN